MGPEVLAGILPRIYPEMLEEVHRHQDEGRATFIVSAAGNDMVAELARVLRMDGGIGTSYAVGPDGLYTGKLNGPFVYGEGKVEAMRALRRGARHRPRRLLRLLGLGQRPADAARVGNPVVVNPDEALLEVAKAEGWQVMRFERLGRKLAIAGAAAFAAAAGGSARALAARRRQDRRLRTMRKQAPLSVPA